MFTANKKKNRLKFSLLKTCIKHSDVFYGVHIFYSFKLSHTKNSHKNVQLIFKCVLTFQDFSNNNIVFHLLLL